MFTYRKCLKVLCVFLVAFNYMSVRVELPNLSVIIANIPSFHCFSYRTSCTCFHMCPSILLQSRQSTVMDQYTTTMSVIDLPPFPFFLVLVSASASKLWRPPHKKALAFCIYMVTAASSTSSNYHLVHFYKFISFYAQQLLVLISKRKLLSVGVTF